MQKRPTLEINAISLRVGSGELVVLTAPGSAGIEGHRIALHGDDISDWNPDVQLKAGLFITTGHPAAVPGIRTIDLLHRLFATAPFGPFDVAARLAFIDDWCRRLGVANDIVERHLDAGFSTAEGCALELLQLAIIQPDAAIIDLANAPADDATPTIVANGLRRIRADRPDIAILVITNDAHLIDDLAPDHIHHSSDPTNVRADRDETLL